VSLSLMPRRTYGLVGESGSGKSTLGRALLGLQAGVSGSVKVAGHRMDTMDSAARRQLRRKVQMIYQDPLGSFDPRQALRSALTEPLRVHKLVAAGPELDRRLEALVEEVDLPASVLDRRLRQLSGGQRQRAAIARAISLEPELLVADEPFASLDVTTQARVVALLSRLQREHGLTQLIISHDLSLMDLICDEVFVMYLGEIVEAGPVDVLSARPAHPYTISLRSAVPVPDPDAQRQRPRILLTGDPPGPAARPQGCPFHTRCPFRRPQRCDTEKPVLRELPGGQRVACHFAEEFVDGRAIDSEVLGSDRVR
jgi:peptide/nickel transport system ATP-binding protein